MAVRSWLLRNGPTSLEQAASYLENYFMVKCTVWHPEGPQQEQGQG